MKLSLSMNIIYLIAFTLVFAVLGQHAEARDRVSIVGSSTVYPFSTAVAERVGSRPGMRTAVVESTGTGGGIRLFCSGVGNRFPDLVNASRPMMPSEYKHCQQHGVNEIVEIPLGIDGLVLATGVSGAELSLSREQIWLAVAEHGPKPRRWSEIDSSLPDQKILIYLPPPTSGTRDSFHELVLTFGCPAEVRTQEGRRCEVVRRDGVVVEVGENDSLVVQKLTTEPEAIGIFGFSYLDLNRDRIRGVVIDGVSATEVSIQDGSYPLARPLFVYLKRAHLPVIAGLQDLVKEFTSDSALGDFGYLGDLGLIAFPDSKRRAIQQRVERLELFTPS